MDNLKTVFAEVVVNKQKAEIAELKEAIKPVIAYYKWLAITEQDEFEPGELIIGSSFCGVTKEQLDKLVELVGE